MSEVLENFERAFETHSGGCRRECECGRVFYNPNGGRDWEDGELEKLAGDGNAQPVEWSVETISFEGKEYVSDCNCWHARANVIIGFLNSHAGSIAKYLSLEKKRKQAIAGAAPVVEGEYGE
jgi:hypothetical protein